MKLKDITSKSDQELQNLAAETRTQLAQAVIDIKTRQAKGVKQIHVLKKTVARILTIQQERHLSAIESTVETPATPAASSSPRKITRTRPVRPVRRRSAAKSKTKEPVK